VVSRARQAGRRRALAVLAAGSVLAVTVGQAAYGDTFEFDFEDGAAGTWAVYGGTTMEVVGGELCFAVPANSGDPWSTAAQLKPITFAAGDNWDITFEAHATRDVTIPVQAGGSWPDVFGNPVNVTTTKQPFAVSGDNIAWSAENGGLDLQLGGKGEPYTLCIDNFFMSNGEELIPGGDFAEGQAGFWSTGNMTPDVSTGAFCVDVPAGTTNPWDAIVGVGGLPITEGVRYRLQAELTATGGNGSARIMVQNDVNGAWNPSITENVVLPAGTTVPIDFTFEALETYVNGEGAANGQLVFQVGGAPSAWTLCLDNVSLFSGAPEAPYEPDTGPRVRVNQHGYATFGPKAATLVTEATAAVPWTLKSGATEVATGTSSPKGVDASSGLNVHVIDFSGVTTEGADYTLEADGEVSHPFAIGGDLYEDLRVDSLSFFYPQRSGIEILGSVAGEAYARPAGHVGVAPNQGDTAVTCLPAGALQIDGADAYDGYTCDYTLDVSGGWYDAGDHGKYVVNGGISVAQLMATYERSLYALTADEGALADGTLRVPESDNGVPDVLDEARWELEWMLKMIVPEGEQYEGMVHHKVHDAEWTGLPKYPHLDEKARYLHRPSTAATLNLAAVAAQGARLFAEYDAAFAAELLDAATVAYDAALATPDLYAPNTNLATNPGGGPYNDAELDDEFYWAAAELYITTGEDTYLDDVLANPFHLGGTKDAFQLHGFDWMDVAGFARIELATVPSLVPNRQAIKQSVLDAAWDVKLLAWNHPFGIPYAGVDGRYEWGSNGKVLNNIALLGAAFDLSGNPYYLKAALMGMDYILGRNALNISYVTGYGDVYAQNMHSRWYAAAINAAYPHPPVGTVSGGPNSDIPDPISGPLLAGCAPQFCYVDNIEAWGVNELTINWNSALSYVASFLADVDDAEVEKPFTDVPVEFPFVQEIRWLADSGITTGFPDGTFRPSASVERQAMAAFLYRAAGSPDFDAPATSPFRDVRTGDPFYKEITWLADTGITTGFSDGTFRPTAPIERQAMAAFLYRMAGEPDFTPPATSPFSDVRTNHPFYKEISWLAAVQVTTGYSDGTYRSTASVARDAMAAFLHRSLTLPVSGVQPIV